MWYDLFALFYDRALEDLYAPYRAEAVKLLRLSNGSRVLDLPCGTGQSLDLLSRAVGAEGAVLGVDRSRGMLRRAHRRVQRAGWANVRLRRADVLSIDAEILAEALPTPGADAVLCSLGLTALPDWEAAFDRMFSLLRPGGRFVLFDVHAREPNRQTRAVELVARADLTREAWRPLAAWCGDFERRVLSSDVKTFGGELYVAAGTRQAESQT